MTHIVAIVVAMVAIALTYLVLVWSSDGNAE